MTDYTPPLADYRFLLRHVLGFASLSALPRYSSVSNDFAEDILAAAGDLASGTFAPLNHSSDKIGAKFENKKVIMPKGCKEAYHAFVAAGWNGMPFDAAEGGQDMPWTLTLLVQEMLQSANLALALCTLLNQGAIELLSAHGSEALKKTYLPKMMSGEWTGTMNLTEPQAGSDVGAVRCKAWRDGDYYRLQGQKIFISYGDHDLSENIIHMVLARLPDAAEGTKGLSLFLAPKILVNDAGDVIKPNDVSVVSIEHKLGQHASPTCVMSYGDQGGAIGFLVGKEGGGIAAMFTMMNNARIGVGIQGLALCERAYQDAKAYALTRIQSKDLTAPQGPSVPIIVHPDVKRMLLSMKAQIDAARGLALSCGMALDVAKHGEAPADKQQAQNRVDLLTPIVKAWLTDLANEITSTAIQIYGGMGYVEEAGVAQHYRDARVLAIYEGTNGIQANDFVFRKLLRDGGLSFRAWYDDMQKIVTDLSQCKGDAAAVMHRRLGMSLSHLRSAVDWVLANGKTNPAAAAAGAVPLLKLAAITGGGAMMAAAMAAAQKQLASPSVDQTFYENKLTLARFYADHVLTQSSGLLETVTSVHHAVTDRYDVL